MPVAVIARKQWGGPTNFNRADGAGPGARTIPASRRRGVCIHWDGANAVLNYPYNKVMAKLQAQHATVEGGSWGGIGYNYVVTGDGRVWEGRGKTLSAVAHPLHNDDWYHVQIHVGKKDPGPTPAQLASTRALALDLDQYVGRKLGRYVHSDGWATECPGPQITRWVRAGMPTPTTGRPPMTVTPLTYDQTKNAAGEGVAAIGYGTAPNRWTFGAALPEIYNAARYGSGPVNEKLVALAAAVAQVQATLDGQTVAIQALAAALDALGAGGGGECEPIDVEAILSEIAGAGVAAAQSVRDALTGATGTFTLDVPADPTPEPGEPDEDDEDDAGEPGA